MKSSNDIDPAELRRVLRYDRESGLFYWRVSLSRSVRVGDEAGFGIHHGYRMICISGKKRLAHRIAWAIVHGEWPTHQIDHVNGDQSDNRWSNLREATHTQNMRNSKRRNNRSGYKGVSYYKPYRKWRARIKVDGKEKYLGYFDHPEAAHAAYAAAATAYYGEFARAA